MALICYLSVISEVFLSSQHFDWLQGKFEHSRANFFRKIMLIAANSLKHDIRAREAFRIAARKLVLSRPYAQDCLHFVLHSADFVPHLTEVWFNFQIDILNHYFIFNKELQSIYALAHSFLYSYIASIPEGCCRTKRILFCSLLLWLDTRDHVVQCWDLDLVSRYRQSR